MSRRTSSSLRTALAISALSTATLMPSSASAVDGGTLRLNTANGWRAFEVISEGDDPADDGFAYAMPGTFDGAGAYLVDADTLRILSNHETGDAAVSEVDLDLSDLKIAIDNMIANDSLDGQTFVRSARQAYDRWSDDQGATWTDTSDTSTTSFYRFCSGQAYAPNTFGTDRGFVDDLYITGEEGSTERLFVLDSANREFYQLSGTVGSAPGGNGGLPNDAWENAALIDTGETAHVALLLSPDGGSTMLQLYIGEKGKDKDGNASTSFLARNGLAYGSSYFLSAALPDNGGSETGSIDIGSANALAATKMEDVDTSPSNPTRVVLGNQNWGTFVLDFSLTFGASFDASGSSFSITEIAQQGNGANQLDDADNVDWTAATTLNGVNYPDGIVFVNEDNSSGEIWMMYPDGAQPTLIGSTIPAAESTGIFDLSPFVGYEPGSVMITNNQGSSSMSILINPAATLEGGDGDGDGDGGSAETTDGSASGTGESGDSGSANDGGSSGCDCRQDPGRENGTGWLAMFGLLGFWRSRRKSTKLR